MARKTITIKGDGVRYEAKGVAVITPGMLVELTSAAAEESVQPHSTADGNAERSFAVEDDLQGKEIGDNYAINDRVQYNLWNSGDEVLAILNDGENVVRGDKLSSAGNGNLKKFVSDSAGAVEVPEPIVAVAMEAVDMSDSSAADPTGRIIVRIL